MISIYLTMKTCILEIFTLLLISIFIPGVSSTCDPPTTNDLVDLNLLTQISTVQSTYTISERIVYRCNDGYGYGYFLVTCEANSGNSTWGTPTRDCNHALAFDWGSLSGILCAVITLIVCIIGIIFSSKLKYERSKEEEVEMKIMDAAGATKA